MWDLRNETNRMNIINRNRLTDIEKKLVVTSREKEEGKGKIGVGD